MLNKNWYKHFLISIVLVITSSILLNAAVKEIGVPVIQNFQRSAYQAGTQNWSIAQTANGVMYFGNNQGLLQYDGQEWNIYQLANGSNIRSVLYSNTSNVLYAGGFNEFGYFTNDSVGVTTYTSLKPLLPDDFQEFGDIWRIFEGPWGIIFQAFEGIIIYKDNEIKVIRPRSLFHFSYFVNGTFYVFDRDNGLLEFRNGYLKKIPGGEFFAQKEVWSMLPLNNDELLIGTAKDGLFYYNGISLKAWDTPVNEVLKQYQIYSSLLIDNDHIAFGTIQNGLVICDRKGNISQIINREKGLQNNTILSMCLDLDGNLWLGLDNGIDYVELNSPVTLLQDFYGFGTGYTSIIYNNLLYLGTNQGLFYCQPDDFKNPKLTGADFKMVSNTSGQVWSLQIINNQLYCGHNNGAFLINNNIGTQISEVPGCWAFNALPVYPNLYIEGTYNGLELWRQENGKLVHLNEIKGINHSCQEIAILANGQIWISHSFAGLELFELTEDLDSVRSVKKYSIEDGLPNPFMNKVKKMNNGDLLITTSKGIYQYNNSSDRFDASEYYNKLFEYKPIQYIQEDASSNIWYITVNNEGGVLRKLEDGTYINVTYPFSKLKGMFIGSFFHFNVIDENNVLIALEKGYAHYNPKLMFDYRRAYSATLNSVSTLDSDSILFSGLWQNSSSGLPQLNPQIAYKYNSLRFTFSGLFFEGEMGNRYSYFLEGFDHEWSDWQSGSTKEYTNLPDGDYTFRIKTRNIYGIEATPTPFSFSILPPWYKSIQAIVAYFIISIIFIWVLILIFLKNAERKRIHELEIQQQNFKKKEEKLKTLTLEAEKEIIRLRNEKLHSDMIHKDKELANSAMNLVQKNRQLNKIKGELKKIQSEIKEELVKSRLSMIIRKIEKETSNDESWSIFETNFEQVHEDFLKRIREMHPEISPKELKLAAYLRMNISSKEIATLMNITTRGVEISRYRLRRKLNLDRSQNLTDYILSI